MWASDEFDHKMLLFIAYIVDEKINTFDIHLYKDGRAESIKQVESIKQWEYRNNLDSLLSNCYARCLELFIKNNFAYESSWNTLEIHENIHCSNRCKIIYSIVQQRLLRSCRKSKKRTKKNCHFRSIKNYKSYY